MTGGPGTIVITLVNGASSASRQLEKVGLGSVFDAMNEIIADNPGDLPARTTYSMERISSREQLGVSLRAEYNSLSTDVQGSFSYESDVSFNRFLVRLTQSYYTIAFEAPTDPADFFGPGGRTSSVLRIKTTAGMLWSLLACLSMQASGTRETLMEVLFPHSNSIPPHSPGV